MVTVGFLPQELNLLANCLVSLSCAMQLNSFRKINGSAYASTMCIGNMKSFIATLSSYLRTRNAKDLIKAHSYLMVILIFSIGAGVGGNFSTIFNEKTIWGSAALLIVCCLLMGLDNE